jgi:photosystem II stability/assembly factor-like uncharacterized protein
MNFLNLTFLCCMVMIFSSAPILESPSASTKIDERAANFILQSKDGGQTWQDISRGLPEPGQPEGFFAGASEVYLRTNGLLYRSKSNLKTPVWEKENFPDARNTSIVFNQSGVIAYSYDGYIYRKKSSSDPDSNRDWLPIYTNLKSTNLERHEVATIFEATDGTVFKSTGKSFAKSTDHGRTWKLIPKGWVGDIVESEGVLLATGVKGIMRSTDQGENWEWVISEGGVGIAIERIDGGFAAIAYNTQTKSRRIHISFDDGKTWKAIDEGLQPSSNISSVKQLGNDLFVGHPDGIFSSSDMGKTWHRVHAGFGNDLHTLKFVSLNSASVEKVSKQKVFKLHVSGNALYAVAVLPGC